MAQRLTGFALLTRVNVGQQCNESRDKIARDCGYIRDNGKIVYKAFYEELLKIKAFLRRHDVRMEAEQKPGSINTSRIIEALKNKKSFHYRNDEVVITDPFGGARYYYYGEIVASYHPESKFIQVFANKRTKSTKERLNRILMHFTGYKLFQKNNKWFLLDGFNQILFEDGMTISMLDWNNPV